MVEDNKEIRQRILTTAHTEFLKFGFTRVTVDEIAGKMGMSKKTIYKHFPSKDDLVDALMKSVMASMEKSCDEILAHETTDFVEKLRSMMTLVAVQYSGLGRPLLEDLEKNAPNIWKRIDEFRSKRIMLVFGRLLEEGVGKGSFRSDIDRQLILMIYTNAIQTIINPHTLLHLPFTAGQVFESIVKVLFEGILTDEARREYVSESVITPSIHKGEE